MHHSSKLSLVSEKSSPGGAITSMWHVEPPILQTWSEELLQIVNLRIDLLWKEDYHGEFVVTVAICCADYLGANGRPRLSGHHRPPC
jgi:hypothetical protein